MNRTVEIIAVLLALAGGHPALAQTLFTSEFSRGCSVNHGIGLIPDLVVS